MHPIFEPSASWSDLHCLLWQTMSLWDHLALHARRPLCCHAVLTAWLRNPALSLASSLQPHQINPS
eukprot:3711221-Amphidinium_carterae.1